MKKRRSGLQIMRQLIVLVKPLTGVMLLGILLGVIGYLCAIFLTILGAAGIIKGIGQAAGNSIFSHLSWSALFTVIIIVAVARGILHYGEQYCNHYIAFRILAIIRHKVFAALRKLCPAKLEGKEKGNLITVITSDIELLEVFFAHTISPIAIAFLTSLIMVFFIGAQHWLAGLIALAAYLSVGVALPLWNGRRTKDAGMALRNGMGEINSYILNSLYGLDETIQYQQGEKQADQLDQKSVELAAMQKRLGHFEGSQKALTNLIIQAYSWGMLFVMLGLYTQGAVSFGEMLLATIAMMGSFGPVVALSSLSNTLSQTLACGERVLSLLEEKPETEEISGNEVIDFNGAEAKDVSFAYGDEKVFSHFSMDILKNQIIGLHGASGSGKSTFLKLLMRFWVPQSGSIEISQRDINQINTDNLRNIESYMTQETILFHDTIAANIAIAKQDATRDEIITAAKKASIHDFIMTLPDGYDTKVSELGDSLSGGEKQRIGLARAFLHEAPLMLLDEPTSNLDALNEGIILKSLKRSSKDKTVLLVSHRQSTMGVADQTIEFPDRNINK